MKTIWFMDLPKDEQEGFKKEVKSAKNVLEKLEQIVKSRLKEIVVIEDYDSPSWAYKQADRNGYNRALTEIINILNLDHEVNK
jgi:hypothetical protein